MPIDPTHFVAELGLNPETTAMVLDLFAKNPQMADKLNGLMTTQVDAAMAPLKADLAKKSKDLDDQFATLESVRGTDSATLDTANRRVEQAVAAVTLAKERLRRMATDFGADPDAWAKDIELPMPGTPPSQTPTSTGTPAPIETPMDSQRILQTAGLQVWNGMRSMAEMNDLAHEHNKLFGSPLAQQALLDRLQERVKRTGNGNLTLRDVWRDEYKVGEKQQELQEAEIKRRETDAYERGKREAADAAALGTAKGQAPPPFVQSPVLAALTKDQPTHISGVPDGVIAAIADYRQRRLNAKPA